MQSAPSPVTHQGLPHPELGICSLGSRALPSQSPKCLSCGRCPLSHQPGLGPCPAPPALCPSPGPQPPWTRDLHCPLGFSQCPRRSRTRALPPGQLQASRPLEPSGLTQRWDWTDPSHPQPLEPKCLGRGVPSWAPCPGDTLGGQGPHCHHRRVYLHMCGHVDVRGGWHGHLARCPRLIVGFGSDGGGGAGVTAEALTD